MSLPAFDGSATSVPASPTLLALVPRDDAIVGPGAAGPASGRLDLVPQSNLQPRDKTRLLVVGRGLGGAVAVHAIFALLFVILLNWRELPRTREEAIPVEIVSRMPGQAGMRGQSGAQGGAAPVQPQSEASPGGAGPQKPVDAAPSATPPAQPRAAAQPHLVEPPPEAAQAATQTQENKRANVELDATKPDRPTPAPPAAAPNVVASAAGESLVAKAAPVKGDALPSPKPAEEAKPNPLPSLAAALPMDPRSMPSNFRAMLSGGGLSVSDEYKGLVSGKLRRSTGAVESARARHLRGQVVVSFSVDDAGNVEDLQVAQSSGTAAVDAAALDMVREAAPFPPPPPGSQRTFSPVLLFGEP